MKSFQRSTQSTAVSELQTMDVPFRVLVSEPDITSRRLICALLQSDAETTVTCVEDSQLLSAVHETAPHIVVVDVHSPSIRRALNWETLGIQEAPATIVTGFDPSVVSPFASTAVDFLVKPFDVERLESALDLATAAIGPARSAETPADSLRHAENSAANFTDPADNFGTQRRNQFRGPGYFDADFDVEKSFNLPKWESAQFSVGARFFNLFNHSNFAFPNTNADSGQFGQITQTVSQPTTIYGSGLGADASPRVIELQAKFVF